MSEQQRLFEYYNPMENRVGESFFEELPTKPEIYRCKGKPIGIPERTKHTFYRSGYTVMQKCGLRESFAGSMILDDTDSLKWFHKQCSARNYQSSHQLALGYPGYRKINWMII